MKTNLKNFPKYAPVDKKKCYDWFEYGRLVNDWKTDFEKELRELTIRPNIGDWIRRNSDSKNLGEFLTRFINEVLGDEK
ncbi:hypothetical protein MUP01_10885 [Candidatus Bathyarchaeota archaeon]|nr:hypothetical protein [Candidatus Bathyarchaeota archaeon]